MPVSKAYLRTLTRIIKDPGKRASVRKFLVKHSEEINTNKLVITGEGKMFYEGSIGPLTYYKLWGRYHRRKKSSLTTKRFRKDKAFKGSRKSAERFAAGNKLASKLYAMVELQKKKYKLFCLLKKRAIELIKEGNTVEESQDVLADYLRSSGLLREEGNMKNEVKTKKQRKFPSTLRIADTEMIIKPKFPLRGTGGRATEPGKRKRYHRTKFLRRPPEICCGHRRTEMTFAKNWSGP